MKCIRKPILDSRLLLEIQKNESGAVIILFAISLVAIIGFLAMGIDLTRMTAASSEQKSAVRTAALSALQAYRNEIPPAGTPAEQYEARYAAAISRAEEVLGFDKNAGLFGNLEAGTHFLEDTSERIDSGGTNLVGTITPGDYFSEEPRGGCASFDDTSSACPCPSGSWVGNACFRPNDITANKFTALEINLNSADDQKFLGVFTETMHKAITGTTTDGQNLLSKGRASMAPRVSIYGIDLSRSIAFDTHVPASFDTATNALQNPGVAAEYVYELNISDPAALRCAGGGNYNNPCLADATPDDNNDGCRMLFAPFHEVYYTTPEVRPGIAGASTEHYRDDYSCYVVDGRHFLIDTSVHALNDGSTYYGPQPLTDILGGMSAVVETLENEAIPGDEIGVFGFDSTILPERRLGPINPFDTTTNDWNDFRSLVDIESLDGNPANSNLLLRLITYKLFPFPEAQTDITFAVFEAGKMFPDVRFGDLQLTLFSDFLNSCRRYSGGDFLSRPAGVHQLVDPECRTASWANDWNVSAWSNSWVTTITGLEQANLLAGEGSSATSDLLSGQYHNLNDVKDFEYPTFAARGIRINTVLLGDFVEPHKLLQKSSEDPTKCLGEKEARKLGIPQAFSDSGVHANLACTFMREAFPDCVFIGAGRYAQDMAARTGGFYLPIRKPCDVAAINTEMSLTLTQTQCNSGGLEDLLDSQICAPWDDDTMGHEWVPELNRTIAGRGEAATYPGATAYSGLEAAGVINRGFTGGLWDPAASPAQWRPFDDGDASDPDNFDIDGSHSSRIVCDTRCRNIRQQVENEIANSFKINPYTIVRDDT